MKGSARYEKIVEWSDEEGCYMGSASGLISRIVDGAVEQYQQDGKPLPPPTAGHDWACCCT